MKIALCLLVKNEYPCLKIMMPRMRPYLNSNEFSGVYAIDGGSTDGTVEFLKENNVTVISQSKKGRGQAFHHAFNDIDADAYVFYSPDGNEDEKDLPKFRGFLESGNDLVIASRMCEGAVNEEDIHIFRWRKWANNAFNILANVLFRRSGSFVTDSINGYRAITKTAAQKLKLSALDYTIEYQMTIRAFKHHLRIVEFPTVEGQRVAGDTGAPSIQTGIKFLKRLYTELLGKD